MAHYVDGYVVAVPKEAESQEAAAKLGARLRGCDARNKRPAG